MLKEPSYCHELKERTGVTCFRPAHARARRVPAVRIPSGPTYMGVHCQTVTYPHSPHSELTHQCHLLWW